MVARCVAKANRYYLLPLLLALVLTEVVFCWQTIFVAADQEHEMFEHLPIFPSYLSTWRSISLYLFVSFSMDVIVLHYYVHCLFCIEYFRVLLLQFCIDYFISLALVGGS